MLEDGEEKASRDGVGCWGSLVCTRPIGRFLFERMGTTDTFFF